MTLTEAKNTVREYSFTLTRRDGEFRLCPMGGTEAQAYYTNDIADAIGTAKAEHARWHARSYIA